MDKINFSLDVYMFSKQKDNKNKNNKKAQWEFFKILMGMKITKFIRFFNPK
jgi:hypothetical protein